MSKEGRRRLDEYAKTDTAEKALEELLEAFNDQGVVPYTADDTKLSHRFMVALERAEALLRRLNRLKTPLE